MSWTPEQLQAIESTQTDLIVTAGAGSGKTTTMIERALRLVLNGVPVERITMLTFTAAAAKEMKEKFRVQLSAALAQATDKERREYLREQLEALPYASISTIHGFCSALIREFFEQIPLSPAVRILDEDGEALLRQKAFDKLMAVCDTDPELDDLRQTVALRRDSDLQDLIEQTYNHMTVQPDRKGWLEQTYKELFDNGLEGTPAMRYMVDKCNRYAREVCTACRQMMTQDALSNCPDADGNKALEVILGKFTLFENCSNGKEMLSALALYSQNRKKVMPKNSPRAEAIERLRDVGKEMIVEPIKRLSECGTYEEMTARHNGCAPFVRKLIDIVQLYEQLYTEAKQEMSAVDFCDLEKYTLQLLTDDELAQEIRMRRDYMFVDEYQDTNHVQETIIRKVTPQDRLFVVGDSKQCIYRFRQAEPQIFLDTLHRLEQCDKSVALLDNFRSEAAILDFANRLFGCLMTRDFGGVDYAQEAAFRLRDRAVDPQLVTISIVESEEKEKECFEGVYRVQDHIAAVGEDTQEAQRIYEYIQGVLGKEVCIKGKTRAIGYNDIAILFRKRSQAAGTIVDYLASKGVPLCLDSFATDTGQMDVARLLQYVFLIDNRLQDYPLLTVMRSAFGCFCDDDLAAIRLAYDDYIPYVQAARRYAEEKQDSLSERLRAFWDKVDYYRFESSFVPVVTLLQEILLSSGYADHLLAQEDGAARLNTVQAFVRGLGNKPFACDLSTLCDYYRNVDLSTLKMPAASTADGVIVSTVHASKGLEYPVVILACCGDTNKAQDAGSVCCDRVLGMGVRYYDRQTRRKYVTPVMKAIADKRLQATREDGLRLLYVGVTRAQCYLLISGTVRRSAKALLLPELGNSFAQWVQYALDKAPDLRVHLHTMPQATAMEIPQQTQTASEPVGTWDWSDLDTVYPYREAVALSPKYTVTALNRHAIEGEAELPSLYPEESKTALGTLYHTVMQYVDYAATDPDAVRKELDDMAARGLFGQAESEQLDCAKIAKVLRLPLMQQAAKAQEDRAVWREKRFVMLVDATELGFEAKEKVLVQGTVDLLFAVGDELVVVDFKNSCKSEDSLRESYQTQLELYAKAANLAMHKPVTHKYIVELGRALVIEC